MSRRLTISVPDDVAEQLAAIPDRQVSAYVTEALRRRRTSDDMRAALAEASHREYPYNPDASVRRLADRKVSHEVRDAAIAQLAESLGRSVDDVRAELDRRAAR
jgi:hypothetical protein